MNHSTGREKRQQAVKITGVKRRMEVRGEAGGVTVLDDFAHHPTALLETIRAIRQKYPHRRVWALFEPRSNTTRRNVFQQELADALAALLAESQSWPQPPPAHDWPTFAGCFARNGVAPAIKDAGLACRRGIRHARRPSRRPG